MHSEQYGRLGGRSVRGAQCLAYLVLTDAGRLLHGYDCSRGGYGCQPYFCNPLPRSSIWHAGGYGRTFMDPMAERMAVLLRYANYQKVGDALGVGRAAVQKWAKGRNVGPYQLEQVERLFGEPFGTTKDALPSDWEGRFEKIWGLLVATAIASGVDLERVEEMQRELAALRPSPLPDAQRRTEGAHSRDG